MDFCNEALNALRMRQLLDASEFVDASAIVIPRPFLDLTTRCAFALLSHPKTTSAFQYSL
jgi:hypothetical protein